MKRQEKLVTAHCDGMAGIGGVCSHTPSVLFYLEAALKAKKDPTSTEQATICLSPHKCKVEYLLVGDLDMESCKSKRKKFSCKVDASYNCQVPANKTFKSANPMMVKNWKYY